MQCGSVRGLELQCGSVRGLEWALRERQPCRCLAASPAKNQTTASMQLRRRSGEKSDGEKTSRMLVPLLVIAGLLLLQT